MGRVHPALAAVAAALAVAGFAQAAPWLQPGYDAARTHATDDAGPSSGDVAWTGSIPAFTGARPLLLDGKLYVVNGASLDESRPPAQIWRFDLATAQGEPIAEFEHGTRRLVSDGERFFLHTPREALAVPLAGGDALWRAPLPGAEAAEWRFFCETPVVADGAVYYPCLRFAAAGGFDGLSPHVALVAAYDGESGALRWTWERPVATSPRDGALAAFGAGRCAPVAWCWLTGASVVDGRVLVAGVDFTVAGTDLPVPVSQPFVGAGRFQGWVHAVDAADGAPLWSFASEPSYYRAVEGAGVARVAGPPLSLPAIPTGGDGVVYAKLDRVYALNAARGDVLWHQAVGARDDVAEDLSANLAFTGAVVVATSYKTLMPLEAPTGEPLGWSVTLPRGEFWGEMDVVVARGTIFAKTYLSDDPILGGWGATDAFLAAYRLADGQLLWKRPAENLVNFAVGEGVLAQHGGLGLVTVVGTTPASLRPDLALSTAFPGAGEPVRADLAATAPGVHGPATEFRADWGDGNVTPWQASPVLTHAYSADGDYAARFEARNAQQSASVTRTFHVGGAPPHAPTFLERAFSAEHQELTFFLLGLAATGAGGAYGVWRFQRKRRALERELRAIDLAYHRTRNDPAACEALLAERRARANGLFLDRTIDESQLHVLETRLDRLGRAARLGRLDTGFDFLPQGMVRTLRGMLEDGQLNEWEHGHFVEALARDEILTPEQKAKVRGLVDEWFARDAGR